MSFADTSGVAKEVMMLMRLNCLPGLIAFWAIVLLGTNAALAQDSVVEFKKIMREQAAFDETDFAALEQGKTVVRLLPVKDKREVAVSGLVSLQVPAEVFLQSFRENMFRKSNPAILEIGRFSGTPTLDDLQTLTIEDRDLEDLKDCVVGDCKLKLSSAMIERLQKEVDCEYSRCESRILSGLRESLAGICTLSRAQVLITTH